MQVVAAVGESAQQQQDSHSLGIGASALRAIAPTWVAAGRSLADLVDAALSIVIPLESTQAAFLLAALIAALPQVRSLAPSLALRLGLIAASNCFGACKADWVQWL